MSISRKNFPPQSLSAVQGVFGNNHKKCQKPIDNSSCSASSTDKKRKLVWLGFYVPPCTTNKTNVKLVRREEEVKVQPQSSRDVSKLSPKDEVLKTLRLFRLLRRSDEAMSSITSSGRVDHSAAGILKKENKLVNYGKQILGDVPGIEVGDEFHCRVELYIIGLHHQYQAGIDTMIYRGKLVATSIVSFGVYDDYMEGPDVLVYHVQGRTPIAGSKIKVATDQQLERVNLALKNSWDEQADVRVTRKVDSKFIYDGLYKVENFLEEKGHHGTYVFKFRLRRKPGQPELAIKELKKSTQAKVREVTCVANISQRKEEKQLCVLRIPKRIM